MYLADYHTHTKYSVDSEADIDKMCRQAIIRGLDELAVTDHMDIFSTHPYDYFLNCRELYPCLLEAREKYAGKLRIVIGSELGEPMNNPAAGKAFIRDYPELDFIIGSVHQMENDLDVYYYNWKKHDPASTYEHYLDWLIDYAANYDYDVIGHITYPLRYMAAAGITLNLFEKRFIDKIEYLFRIIISRDRGIELNVSGFRQEIQTTMPSPALLKFYRECGGRILTIGSDAHRPEDIGAFIRAGQEIAVECGFSELASYRLRKPDMRRIV